VFWSVCAQLFGGEAVHQNVGDRAVHVDARIIGDSTRQEADHIVIHREIDPLPGGLARLARPRRRRQATYRCDLKYAEAVAVDLGQFPIAIGNQAHL
jgi:hypothetical protein